MPYLTGPESRKNTGWLASACFLLALAYPEVALGVPSGGVITTAMAVRMLTVAEAQEERPVRFRAVVTYINVPTNELFVQDATAGIFVFIRDSSFNAPLETGEQVEIEGVSAPGDFCASITKARIRVLGKAPLPVPLRLPIEYLMNGKEDCQWGELQTVVRSGRVDGNVLYLNAATSGSSFLVMMRHFPADWERTLVDARITFDGVLAAVFNEHRQVSGVRMFIPGPDYITINDPPPASAFDLPLSSASTIGAFRVADDSGHRRRLRAIVTAVASKSLLYASQENASVPVQLDSPCAAQPGDPVDFVGFPGMVDFNPSLQNSGCRVIEHNQNVTPVPVRLRDILPIEVQEVGSGLAIAAGTRYDLKLVTLEGSLVQAARALHSQTLTLSSLDQTFTAALPPSFNNFEESLEPGSVLRITGVCLISFDEFRRPQSVRLLVRRPEDITIETRPPWWTVQRALW